MNRKHFIRAGLSAAALAPSVAPERASAFQIPSAIAPVLLELFTSEGCSSCPPADDVFSALVRESSPAAPPVSIVGLAFHVDYWDQLGWPDRFASADFSARQRDYALAFKTDRLYTPQMIVDGVAEFVGSNRPKAVVEIAKAAKSQKLKLRISPVPTLARVRTGPVEFHIAVEDLAAVSPRSDASVWIAVTENELASDVKSGENAGKMLRHDAVVRSLKSAGSLAATSTKPLHAPFRVDVDPSWRRERLNVVVFVQEDASRRVLGAATTKL